MISTKLQEAFNGQAKAEIWSSNIYLAMSYYFGHLGYTGFAHWMKRQAEEELEHAEEFAQFILKRGGTARVSAIDAVPNGWDSPLAAFEHVYNHECKVSKMIDDLHDLAIAENDKAAQDFLWTFIREQVEEESSASAIVDKIKLGGDAVLYYLDVELGARK